MKVICAWCHKVMKEVSDEAKTSHSICPQCVRSLAMESFEPLQDFLDGLATPVLVVDKALAVLGANLAAQNTLRKELPQLSGQLTGEVMECQHSEFPNRCALSVHCNGCTIRNTVRATLLDGQSRSRVEGFLEKNLPTGPVKVPVFVNTTKVGEVVLLKIDDI